MTVGLQKFPIGRFIGAMVTIWGILLAFTALAKNFAGMMVLRFLLGMFDRIVIFMPFLTSLQALQKLG